MSTFLNAIQYYNVNFCEIANELFQLGIIKEDTYAIKEHSECDERKLLWSIWTRTTDYI